MLNRCTVIDARARETRTTQRGYPVLLVLVLVLVLLLMMTTLLLSQLLYRA